MRVGALHPQTGGSGSPNFPLAIDGNVANGGFALTATGNGTIDRAGQISGSGGLSAGGTAGPSGAPGSPATGAYAVAAITGNGWDNLYFQGQLSAAEVDALFVELAAGASYGQLESEMLNMPLYLNGPVVPT